MTESIACTRPSARPRFTHLAVACARGLCALALAMTPGIGADAIAQSLPGWFSAWTVSHGARQATPVLSGNSVRMIVRPTVSGDQVRLKFENTLGLAPVSFTAVYFGLDAGGAAVVPGTNQRLTFNGSNVLKLVPGAGAWSDPLPFTVQAFQRYTVSVDVFYAADISTHNLGLVTNYSAPGAHAADPSDSGFTAVANAADGFPFFWLSSVDVRSPGTTGTIVTFGDSITDGRCSTRSDNGGTNGIVLPDIYNRWADILATRLSLAPGRVKAVANEGIAGNRVVSGGNGPPAIVRLDRDVLERQGTTHVIFFEATNDISGGATAQTVIDGSQQVIDRIHAAGIKVIGVTVIPRGSANGWTSTMEAQRLAVNDWMRHRANFDGIIDFDTLLQGPVNPANGAVAINPAYSCFDGVHPNPTGYQLMGAAIDLNLFN